MSTPASSVRQRGPKNKTSNTSLNTAEGDTQVVLEKISRTFKKKTSSEWDYRLMLAVITVLAFITRFWGIRHPNQVVFDEVHFGKFASYYLQVI
jgi:dolichyl-phosphate-mannose-protein mannosyltransferase